MAWEVLLWLISFVTIMSLLGIVVYQLICLSDLEFDYINPYDSSSRINRLVIPEFIIQGAFCLLFLLSGHWVMFLLTSPILYYHVQLYIRKMHHVDVTEIFNQLSREKKYRMIKLAYYFVIFFVVIYRLVSTAVFALLEADDESFETGML